jgi:hypothetical protein
VSPSSTTNTGLPAHDLVGAFRSLAPGAAFWKLADHPAALKLNLRGVGTINIPHVASFPAQPLFIGEGQPAPVAQWSLLKAALGPAKKIMIISAISEELEQASPQSVAQVIGRVLSDATNKSIDTIAFDSNAGTAIRPPGLLYNVTPITAATAGVDAMAEDLGALVAAIGAAGIDPSEVVFITDPRSAMIIAAKSGPNFSNEVLISLGVPAKTVIAIAPAGLATGYSNGPQIDTAKETVMHFEGASPGEIVSSPGVVASPSKSVFQSYLLAVRVRAECSWCAAPGAAQVISSVNW